MKNSRSLEIGTGLFVLLGFAALAFLTTQLPGTSLKLGAAEGGYTVTAKFDNIGDLKSGSPVTMAGVRIGRVESIAFDPSDFKAAVVLRIEDQFNEIPIVRPALAGEFQPALRALAIELMRIVRREDRVHENP